MSAELILFIVFAAVAVMAAVNLIVQRHPIHSALSLIVVMVSLAALYLLLGAELLAAVQIIVYAGAIMVLFLFVVMLMNLNAASEPRKNRFLQFAGLISGGCLFLVIIAACMRSNRVSGMVEMNEGNAGLIKNLGMALFKDYVIPFEISSVLFLSAMIGAVVIGKKEK